ncbi:MAG: YfcE family phosphodiesterase [Planctomycetes bacterium]|nr:YfcE family phosphodiesterase [Planctomycetota bacterium]
MKVALLGDIHGNHLALQAALDSAKTLGAERLLITGDLVGYYGRPKEVLAMLEPWKRDMVRGNHEEMLIKARSDAVFLAGVDSKFGIGLRRALEQLSAQQLDQLCALPHPLEIEIGGRRIQICHGSPWDIDQYIYPDADPKLLERCASPDFDVVVLGHTHHPLHRQIGRCHIVNPGSVGQPRNRRPGASWALLDSESLEVRHFVEPYDIASVVGETRTANPQLSYLWEVLERR